MPSEWIDTVQLFTALMLTLYAISKMALTPSRRRSMWTWIAAGSALSAGALIAIVAVVNGNPVRGWPTLMAGVWAFALMHDLLHDHRGMVRGGVPHA